MSKKLERNGLFESSRMMLPEHKEAYVVHQRNLNRKERPLLDEQEVERISHIIAQALQFGREVTLTLYGEFAAKELTGVITAIDQQRKSLKLVQGYDDLAWVDIADIMDVALL